MDKAEILELLRNNLSLNVDTVSKYVGETGHGGMYETITTIKLLLEGELISQVTID